MSDVPFRVLLSGGLDSSLVASVTARYLSQSKTAKENGGKLHSFCIGLEVSHQSLYILQLSNFIIFICPDIVLCFVQGSPDLLAAKEVANYLGTAHQEFHFTVQVAFSIYIQFKNFSFILFANILRIVHAAFQDGIDQIEDVIYHIETYDVTTIRASTPMFLMSRKIKSQGVKVVLSGEGADEVFGGYLYFHKAPNKEEFHRETCRKVLTTRQPYQSLSQLKDMHVIIFNHVQIKALHLYDCLRANEATSAWGLEARIPFLDKEIVNVAMNIDPEWKMVRLRNSP